MSDPKKKIYRATLKAKEHYRAMNYSIFNSDGRLVSFIATRGTDERHVLVVVDRISPSDIESLRGIQSPPACVREIFCDKGPRFEIREVRG